jgi:esterase/lipase superfamily enzyme
MVARGVASFPVPFLMSVGAIAFPSLFGLRHGLRLLGMAGALGLLAACSNVQGGASLTSSDAANDVSAIGGDPTLTIVTTRNPVRSARSSPWFGTERASATQARVQLSAPRENAFASVGLGDWRISSIDAIPVGTGLARGTGRKDVLIYVHGFNQTFETAALDAARLSDGIRFRGETMLFSWPSKARLSDYIYDRESAMWSRDAFESMVDHLIADPQVGRINIVAHSMGTMLTVEVLRQLYDRRGRAVVDNLGAVVLAAPDIDIDSFSSSINRIGPLRDKITVLVAANDRALDVMKQLAGGVTRVGTVEAEKLQALGLRVIDASQVAVGGVNHDLFLSNAKVRQEVRRAIDGATSPAYAGADQPN